MNKEPVIVNINDLVCARDIAERLNLSRIQMLHNWISRPVGFPQPVKTFNTGSGKPIRIWLWNDVKRWHSAWMKKHEGDARQ